MTELSLISVLSYTAVAIASFSYWFQVAKIHKHQEVRDLSIVYFLGLGFSMTVLIVTAALEGTTVFLIKQILTLTPVLIIIGQILYHKDDTWHDDDDPECPNCSHTLEPCWVYCANCGTKRTDK